MSPATWRTWMAVGALALGAAWVRPAGAQDTTTTVTGLHYQPVTPCRYLDTRSDPRGPLVTTVSVPGGSSGDRLLAVRGACGVPPSAKAVALTLTVPPKDLLFRGHMVAFASNIVLPPTSNVNVTPGEAEQNFAIVGLAPDPWYDDMRVHLVLGNNGDTSSLGGVAHLVIDVVGYFFKP
jgi:hypothetical protein